MEATPNSKISSGNGGDNAAQMASTAGHGERREKLMSDLKSVIGAAESWLKNSAEHSGEDLRAAQDKFEATLHMAKTDLMRLEAGMLAKTKLAVQSSAVYVKDNPWKSVGLGAAVGVIFGLLLARR